MDENPTNPTPAPSRIVALDLLRGYFILVIASIHLARYPSLLGLFTGRGQLWISEAEGFFFISGLLIGIIRQRDAARNGFKSAARKLLGRGGKLYLAGTILTTLYLIIGRILSDRDIAQDLKTGLDISSSWTHILVSIFTLQYTYGWADFLVYYALFLIIAPVVLWVLRHGGWWLVLLASATIWYLRWRGSHGMWDPFMQWQVYFFTGSVIGFYWNKLNRQFSALSQSVQHWLKVAAVSGTALIYIGGMIMVFVPQHFSTHSIPNDWVGSVIRFITGLSHNHDYNVMLVDARLGLLRPILELITFAGLFTVVRHYEATILRWVGWLLVPFGSNSLYVYIIESVLLFAIPFMIQANNFAVNSLVELSMIAITWLAIRKQFLFKLIPR